MSLAVYEGVVLTQVERLSRELFPMATRCAKDAVLCGVDYTTEGRRLINSTAINELKHYFLRYHELPLQLSHVCDISITFIHACVGHPWVHLATTISSIYTPMCRVENGTL